MDDPTDASAVSDPLYRLVAKLRRRCGGRPAARTALAASAASSPARRSWCDRPRGAFLRPPDETREPARTERLLANPLAMMRPKAADTLDAVGFALMARAFTAHNPFSAVAHNPFPSLAAVLVHAL